MRLLFPTILAGMLLHSCWAQDLSPRAYLITPLHSNAINLTYSFYHGGLDFNGLVPVTGATGTYSVPIFSLYHSFSFFGRSANPPDQRAAQRTPWFYPRLVPKLA